MFFKKDPKIPNEQDRLKQVIVTGNPVNNQNIDKSIADGVRDNTKQVFQDISQQLQRTNPYPFVDPQDAIPVVMYRLENPLGVNACGVIQFPVGMAQLVIYNPTAMIVRWADKSLTGSGNDLMFQGNPNKVSTYPAFPIKTFYYILASYVEGSIKPYLFAYSKPIFTPNVATI